MFASSCRRSLCTANRRRIHEPVHCTKRYSPPVINFDLIVKPVTRHGCVSQLNMYFQRITDAVNYSKIISIYRPLVDSRLQLPRYWLEYFQRTLSSTPYTSISSTSKQSIILSQLNRKRNF